MIIREKIKFKNAVVNIEKVDFVCFQNCLTILLFILLLPERSIYSLTTDKTVKKESIEIPSALSHVTFLFAKSRKYTSLFLAKRSIYSLTTVKKKYRNSLSSFREKSISISAVLQHNMKKGIINTFHRQIFEQLY